MQKTSDLLKEKMSNSGGASFLGPPPMQLLKSSYTTEQRTLTLWRSDVKS